jgi:hypothetical protein
MYLLIRIYIILKEYTSNTNMSLVSTYIGQNTFDNLKNKSSTETNTPIIPVNKVICMSGGGSAASTFTLGALRRMNECDVLLDADVYSCSSGSTFIMHLLQLCILDKIVYAPGPENKYKVPVDRSWFDKYLRATVYQAYPYTFYMTVVVSLLNPYNLYNFSKTITKVFEQFEAKFPEFYQLSYAGVDEDPHKYLYTYINASTYEITDYNKDLISSTTPITSINWGWRILRSTSPFLYHNEIFSVDAGLIDDNAILPIIDAYSPKEIIIITILYSLPNLPSKLASDSAFFSYAGYVLPNVVLWFFNVVDYNLMKGYRDYFVNDDNIQIAQSVYPSNSQFNQNSANYSNGFTGNTGLFDNFTKDMGYFKKYFNGLFFYEDDIIRIIENEGYSQMDVALNVLGKVPANATPFNLPNPTYTDYATNKKIYDKYVAASTLKLMFNSFVKTVYQVYPTTSLIAGIGFVATVWSAIFQ